MPVSNSSPLIHLTRLGKLGYAEQVYEAVLIPPAVRRETIEEGKSRGFPGALDLERLEKANWIRPTELSGSAKALAAELGKAMSTGEAEAVALAAERKERLFMDVARGRRAAELYRIETVTTLGLMFELLMKESISRPDYERNVKEYGSSGWISGEVVQEFLERAKQVD